MILNLIEGVNVAGGRQRDFEINEALEQAMHLFWKKGFVGASLADLTASMGINKPSLYATFGNKEDLFVQAMAHYLENEAASHFVLLTSENKTLQERLRAYLQSLTKMLCATKKPGGCFVALLNGELVGETLPDKARQAVIDANSSSEKSLIRFFQSEKAKGNLQDETNVDDLALYIVTLIHGMAAMARSGKSEGQIFKVIDRALRAMI